MAILLLSLFLRFIRLEMAILQDMPVGIKNILVHQLRINENCQIETQLESVSIHALLTEYCTSELLSGTKLDSMLLDKYFLQMEQSHQPQQSPETNSHHPSFNLFVILFIIFFRRCRCNSIQISHPRLCDSPPTAATSLSVLIHDFHNPQFLQCLQHLPVYTT